MEVMTCNAFGKPCSGYSAPDRKNNGIITKFMMSGNACMLCIRLPIAVPNAQHTIAMSAIVMKNSGTAMNVVGRKPKMTHRMNTSSP